MKESTSAHGDCHCGVPHDPPSGNEVIVAGKKPLNEAQKMILLAEAIAPGIVSSLLGKPRKPKKCGKCNEEYYNRGAVCAKCHSEGKK